MIRTQPATFRRFLIAALTIAAGGALFSCSDIPGPDDKSGTFFGPTSVLAGGSARAYVILDRTGAPGSPYTLPHFDVHAYMITEAERKAMVLGDAQLAAKMVRQPAAEFIPAGYVPGPVIVEMGMHWTDPAAPERNGQPFTHTFFYGSYDGAFVLNEPMVTKAFLETKPAAVVTPLKLPAQYSVRGYQPTSYTVGYDAAAKEYRIALSGLVER
ncbi:MAG: hypothetical protein H0T48_06880 [Gemmatimonadaceae bacterium]|nr:hypothetical protein [Gemmatimonadaceae bacterium]